MQLRFDCINFYDILNTAKIFNHNVSCFSSKILKKGTFFRSRTFFLAGFNNFKFYIPISYIMHTAGIYLLYEHYIQFFLLYKMQVNVLKDMRTSRRIKNNARLSSIWTSFSKELRQKNWFLKKRNAFLKRKLVSYLRKSSYLKRINKLVRLNYHVSKVLIEIMNRVFYKNIAMNRFLFFFNHFFELQSKIMYYFLRKKMVIGKYNNIYRLSTGFRSLPKIKIGCICIRITHNNVFGVISSKRGHTKFWLTPKFLKLTKIKMALEYNIEMVCEELKLRILKYKYDSLFLNYMGSIQNLKDVMQFLGKKYISKLDNNEKEHRLNFIQINLHTAFPYNGCRLPKRRRKKGHYKPSYDLDSKFFYYKTWFNSYKYDKIGNRYFLKKQKRGFKVKEKVRG